MLSYQYEDIGGGDSNGGTGISEAEARSIAQNRAPGAQIISCELDRDDGQMIYEIELRDGQTEYDCEIRQSDGAVIKWEQDIDDWGPRIIFYEKGSGSTHGAAWSFFANISNL